MNSLPAAPVWIGMDVGTQSVRVLAVTERGEVVGAGAAPLASRRDGPRHEQDPEAWWRAVGLASRAALAEVPAADLCGVAVAATSGTILLTDESGRPLTPGLMYDDTRATAEAERVNAAGGALWEHLGYRRMQAAWALPKLLWLVGNHGGSPPGARLTHQSDFINGRLLGRAAAADWSNALKTGWHLRENRWPWEVFDTLGLPATLLPPVVRPGALLGEVCREAAESTGLPVGTPVHAGMTDGCAAQIGAGAMQPGSWNSVLGTTLVLKGVTAELLNDPGGVVYSHRSPDGCWLPGGASSCGAGAISQAFPGRDLAALDRAAAAFEPVRTVAYPLAGRGERFPFHAPEADPFLLGEPENEAEHFAALLQGIAFIERLCFDYLALLGAPTGGDLFLTGGGAASPYWRQMRADILGRPLKVPENAEPALGMAILAAAGERTLAETCQKMVRIRATIDPRPGQTERYHEPYLRLVTALHARGWLPAALARQAEARLRAS